MKAVCWLGKQNVGLKQMPEPQILNPHDAIIKVSSAAIDGSDLHLYDGYFPAMEKGDILGHETMGEVVDVGPLVKKIKIGDRIVIPFDIACGSCNYCLKEEYANCDNTNPDALMANQTYGHSGAGLFGFSHMFGGYAGGQAEYIRVPFVDTNSLVIPQGIPDEKVLFLSDIFPTGYMAAENCNISRGDTVAIWGAGPVAQMALRSAYMLGAEKVIVIDHFEGRLEMARSGQAHTIHFDHANNVLDELNYLTGGRGPDACIDAVGISADRPDSLRQAIQSCKKGGIISIPGIYDGSLNKIPIGAAFNKGLTFKMGQTHTQKYMKPLLKKILNNEIDPSFVITHRVHLEQAPEAYRMYHDNRDECMKVVIHIH